jgi:hypothetical protein
MNGNHLNEEDILKFRRHIFKDATMVAEEDIL